MKTREELWGTDLIRFIVSTTIVIEERFVDSMGVLSWRLARNETPNDRANRDAAIDNAISELFDRSIRAEKEIADLKSRITIDHPDTNITYFTPVPKAVFQRNIECSIDDPIPECAPAHDDPIPECAPTPTPAPSPAPAPDENSPQAIEPKPNPIHDHPF